MNWPKSLLSKDLRLRRGATLYLNPYLPTPYVLCTLRINGILIRIVRYRLPTPVHCNVVVWWLLKWAGIINSILPTTEHSHTYVASMVLMLQCGNLNPVHYFPFFHWMLLSSWLPSNLRISAMMSASIFASISDCLENGTVWEIALRQFFRESISVSIFVLFVICLLYAYCLDLSRLI